ncbi:MAG TPA: hypothetical protein VFV92_15105 [Candidatus Bathyarchaeia archaeon]|nr:hypothetical protein [Candidatus Bathyarchaeia archaeon]
MATMLDRGLGSGRVSRRPLPARYLVVGQEGCLALGEILTKLIRLKGYAATSLVRFDHSKMLTIYEIDVNGSLGRRDADLMIVLNNEALDYEECLSESGTMIIDASVVTCKPSKHIDTIFVPATILIRDIADGMSDDAKDRFDLALSGLLGSFEAIQNEYPDPELFRRVFEKLEIEPVAPFLAAVYRGYDWLQESWMRGKASCGGRAR